MLSFEQSMRQRDINKKTLLERQKGRETETQKNNAGKLKDRKKDRKAEIEEGKKLSLGV
jgi:hypothetical protein